MKTILICALLALAFAEPTLWNEDGELIADDLVSTVAEGEDPIMVLFFKDQSHKSKIETAIMDAKDFDDKDFQLATVDMNSAKYMDLARDVRISNAADEDYPIIGMFQNGKGFVVKQYGNDESISEIVKKFDQLG